MEKIAQHATWLRYLAVALPNQRKQLLRSISREQISVICEISLNLLRGNIEISDNDLLELSKHKSTYRKLAVRTVDTVTKRQCICRNATGIKTLVRSFLKYYDRAESDSTDCDSSCESDSYSLLEKIPFRSVEMRDGVKREQGFSDTNSNAHRKVSSVNSETEGGERRVIMCDRPSRGRPDPRATLSPSPTTTAAGAGTGYANVSLPGATVSTTTTTKTAAAASTEAEHRVLSDDCRNDRMPDTDCS